MPGEDLKYFAEHLQQWWLVLAHRAIERTSRLHEGYLLSMDEESSEG